MLRKDREIKNIGDIRDILDGSKVCHIAMADGLMPYVVPMSYGYELTDGGELTLYFHCAEKGMKLELMKKNSRVCFEISIEGGLDAGDNSCEYSCFYKSVIGWGEVTFIDEIAEKCSALSQLFLHQTGQRAEFNGNQVSGVCIFKISSSEFTGKSRPAPSLKRKML